MPQERIKNLLSQLHEELENAASADDETREMVATLDRDIHRLLADEEDQQSVIEKAQSMEAHFAAEYPMAERFLREIIDALAKVGI